MQQEDVSLSEEFLYGFVVSRVDCKAIQLFLLERNLSVFTCYITFLLNNIQNSVYTLQETRYVSATKANRLMLFTEKNHCLL
jgi:hypothetical protein